MTFGKNSVYKKTIMAFIAFVFILVINDFIVIACIKGECNQSQVSNSPSIAVASSDSLQSADNSSAGEWNLVLVNRDNPIPADFEADLMRLDNGELIDRRIYPELQAMFDDARAYGVYPIVASGYRTADKQAALFEEKVAEYERQGYSQAEAERLAGQWVALPGHSEHQLGICVDINADSNRNTASYVYEWLDNNAYKYGFIKRYAEDKTDITGIKHEPWHYRYVGKSAAKQMYDSNLCLEEYLG